LAYSPVISTFNDAADLYITKLVAEDRFSPGWRKRVELVVGQLGHLPLEVVPDHFAAWMRNYAITLYRGKKRTATTLNRPVEIVKDVFNHLFALEYVPRNPITKIRFPKYKEKPRNRYLTQEERLRLMNAIRKRRPEMIPLIQYMLLVPCHVSELLKARHYSHFPLK